MQLKECIYRLAYITNTPVKDVAEEICVVGLRSRNVIEYLSQFFRRDFRLGNTFYMGDLERESLQAKKDKEKTGRVTIRFPQRTHERICALAYALDVTPSRATAILLEASITNTNFSNAFTRHYLQGKLDEGRMRELKKVMRFINQNNPYEEEISWGVLLSYLYEELKLGANHVANSLHVWLDQKK